jgi:hypothetical protein
LIGDSIVLGGDTFNPEDRLGPLLEKDLGERYTVWSVAANNWSNVNWMTYLDRNADVLHNADAVITEYSEDDLVAPAVWPGYYVYPDHKPWILTGYSSSGLCCIAFAWPKWRSLMWTQLQQGCPTRPNYSASKSW